MLRHDAEEREAPRGALPKLGGGHVQGLPRKQLDLRRTSMPQRQMHHPVHRDVNSDGQLREAIQ